MVDFEWYRTFVSVYKNGNLTRAAEDLFISQSSASVQIASLESYMEQKLFERKPRLMVPTEFAKRLYSQIADAVEDLQTVEMNFKGSKLKACNVLRIGCNMEYFFNNMVEVLPRKNIDYEFYFGNADEIYSLLDDKKIDFAFVLKKNKPESYTHHEIQIERFVLAASKDFDDSEFQTLLAEGDFPKMEEWLINQNWIVHDNKLTMIRRFWLHNFNKRPQIIPHMVIPNINAISKAVSLNYGISVISDIGGKEFYKEGSIKAIWSGKIPSLNTIYLAYRKDTASSMLLPMVEQLVDNIKKCKLVEKE